MSAAIGRFLSRREMLGRAQNARAREHLSEVAELFEGSPLERRAMAVALAEASRVIDLQTASRNERSFIMLLPPQNRFVVEYLSTKSKWPKVATRLWAWLFEFVSPVDGEVLVTREGLIERVGCRARAVDGVLKELVDIGALIRRREPEPGKQGRGTVRYFMNASVGSCIPHREERAAAVRRDAPLLKVIDGSAHPSQRRAKSPAADLTVL